ncbi:MAG: hypothetical protein PF517_05110 [Salinivirgaceae bacterium]|jgi:hypothetical protein|nr:hypothetical protein [Salinivirgaceae bacterium]
MKKGILIWGYLASFVLLLGAILLNHNFISGKVLYLIGFIGFNLGYLIPLFLVIFKENQENKIGLVLLFSILGFITFLTGVSFFVVNWGGGIILIYVGAGILILAILTLIALSRRFYETHIDSWLPVLVFGVFIVGSLLIGMVHRHVMRAFTTHNKESIEMFESVKANNQVLHEKITALYVLLHEFDSTFLMPIELMCEKNDSIIDYIEDIKIELIQNVEGDAYKILEREAFENLVPIQSNVEINTVSRFMLKSKRGKAYELKAVLNNYKKYLESILPKNTTTAYNFIQASLNTNSYPLAKRRYNRSWEQQHFYHLPLITVLCDLSNIQLKIALIEGELLKIYYLNMLEYELNKKEIEEI